MILAHEICKNDFLVDVVLRMNGIHYKKHFCEYLLATG